MLTTTTKIVRIIPVSGKDSAATALIETTRNPENDYLLIFNDTGCELPETYEWLSAVEAKTGWTIQRIGADLRQIIQKHTKSSNPFLPSPKVRYCTREAKIQPSERFFKQLLGFDVEEIHVYYGLRADECRKGYLPLQGSRIVPKYPLQEMNIDLQGVFSILAAQELLPPAFHWQRLQDAVEKRLRSFEGWRSHFHWWELRYLFSGRTRSNCFFCFFQKQMEFLWLKETHPDLFEEAKRMETMREREVVELMGTRTIQERYTFQPGFALADLDDPARCEKIFDRRVEEAVNTVLNRLQGRRSPAAQDTEIANTSCGLLCGK